MGTDPRPVVVVVEDEPKIRRFVCMALESADLQAYEAESLKRGLIEAGTRQADLVVLDLMLPGRSGLDVLSALRQEGFSKPILIVTARDSVDDRVTGLDGGADDYLVKPFAIAELVARVEALQRRAAGPPSSARSQAPARTQ